MEWLVLLHVLTAIIGVGPAFAFVYLLRSTSSVQEMEKSLAVVSRLEMFPKVFGTIAVLSGIVLFWLGPYGTFVQIWSLGALLLYVIVEILVVAFLNPTAKRLSAEIAALGAAVSKEQHRSIAAMYVRVRGLHMWATVLTLFIFILMILKP